MKSTLEIVDIMYAKTEGSALHQALLPGGEIYKGQRPVSSQNEDVVINCLPIPNQQLQQTIVNVNIHAPDKEINIGGAVSRVADYKRLKELTEIAIAFYEEDYSGDDYYFELQQQTDPIEDEEAGSHYVNLRIEFYSINISN